MYLLRSLGVIFTVYWVSCLVSPSCFAMDPANQQNQWIGKLEDGTKITRPELLEIMINHAKWTMSGGQLGQRANLKGARLKGADLKEVILRGSILSGADLTNADLSKSDLRGADLSNAELSGINLSKAELYKANLNRANLSKAILKSSILRKADLSDAILESADIRKATLSSANLENATLQMADLREAFLFNANLRGANLVGADLSNADLSDAKLIGVNCLGANFSNASLVGTDFSDTELRDVNLHNSIFLVENLPIVYEPKAGTPPYIPTLLGVPDLDRLKFYVFSHGLVDLREGLKKYGYRDQERKVVFALKHGLAAKAKKSAKPWKRVEGMLTVFLFEYTCQWGMSPGRPLIILLGFIVLFSVIYVIPLMNSKKKDGIWRVWLSERVRSDLGTEAPELLKASRWMQIMGFSFYFSLLSAFNVGWRDINVGNWIARMQPREYTLKATGWIRTVSGIQAFISVYLLALSVLTYFGRPFDQF